MGGDVTELVGRTRPGGNHPARAGGALAALELDLPAGLGERAANAQGRGFGREREIALRGEGTAISDADELAVLAKMVKQRQESVKVYLEGARLDLADKEIAEIKVIEEFLPKQLTTAEVEAAIAAAVAEVGAASVKDMGRVMAVLKAKYTGSMDFGSVGALIKARLA